VRKLRREFKELGTSKSEKLSFFMPEVTGEKALEMGEEPPHRNLKCAGRG
jgi:hypothetical protein